MRIDDRLTAAHRILTHTITINAERANGLKLRLDALSPYDTLRRGYAIVQRRDDGSVVSAHTQVDGGDEIDITLTSGRIEAEVLSAEQKRQE